MSIRRPGSNATFITLRIAHPEVVDNLTNQDPTTLDIDMSFTSLNNSNNLKPPPPPPYPSTSIYQQGGIRKQYNDPRYTPPPPPPAARQPSHHHHPGKNSPLSSSTANNNSDDKKFPKCKCCNYRYFNRLDLCRHFVDFHLRQSLSHL